MTIDYLQSVQSIAFEVRLFVACETIIYDITDNRQGTFETVKGKEKMYYLIDNYDSFVYNLAAYMEELGVTVTLIRSDKITAQQLIKEYEKGNLEGIILSPGPKSPKEQMNGKEILMKLSKYVPVLGVCLGHQMIGDAFGAEVKKGKRPMHGKVSLIFHDGLGIFEGLPERYPVTRYHSLVIEEENFPECLMITARAQDGSIQGIQHKYLPVYGVQFHPEAVMTECGHELLGNFIKICDRWRENHEDIC